MSNYNASIQYTQRNGRAIAFGLWVMDYDQPHTLAGNEATSRWYKHFYPRSYAPGVMSIHGRVRTQYRYDQLADYIRGHQEHMLRTAGASNIAGRTQIPLLRLSIPSENIYIDGWVETFKAGAKRFDPAPEFDLDFVVIRDNHSANVDLRPAYAIRSWFTGAVIEQGREAPRVETQVRPGPFAVDDDGPGGRGGR